MYDLYCLSNKTSQGTFHIGLSVSRRRFFLNPQLHSVFWPSALLKQKYWVASFPDKLHQNPPVRQRKQFHSREKTPLGKYTPLDTLCGSRNKAEKGDFAWHSRHQAEVTGWPQHQDHFFSNIFHIILEDLPFTDTCTFLANFGAEFLQDEVQADRSFLNHKLLKLITYMAKADVNWGNSLSELTEIS